MLLTATIEVGETPNVVRADVDIRFGDYVTSLRKWLKQSRFKKIVFVENSGFDARLISESISSVVTDADIEILSFDGSDYEPALGKGYGEKEIIKYAMSNSRLLDQCDGFVKVNGRYFVAQLDCLISLLPVNMDIFSDLRPCFDYSDSRVFYCSKRFYSSFLEPALDGIDERIQFYFEHALAKAIMSSIKVGFRFRLMPPIEIDGFSGSQGHSHKRGAKRKAGDYAKFFCRRLVYFAILKYKAKCGNN